MNAQESDPADPFVYDKASYHYDGDWPEGLPKKQAYVHTGFYLGWVIARGLYSRSFAENHASRIDAFKRREMTGPQVYETIGGVFTSDMLSEEGHAFTDVYFRFKKGRYLKDYGHVLADVHPTAYHVEDTWNNYERMATRIDLQFDYWKDGSTEGA